MTKESNVNENNYSVYIHTTPNGKMYVGITKRKPETRWGRNGNNYKGQIFYNAIEKYGWDNIEHEIVAEHLTKEEAENFEITLIDKLHTRDKKYGYNVSSGGEGVHGLCGEKHPYYGKPMPEEIRQKISMSKRLNPKKCTDEELKRMSETSKEIWAREGYREKMSGKNASAYGKCGADNPTSKKVICLNTGEVYDSAKIASEERLCSHSKLCACCRGERKSCGKDEYGNKLAWMYYEDYINSSQEEILKKKDTMAKKQPNMKKVICINTSDVYESVSTAGRSAGVKQSKITLVCKGIRKSTGKDENGKPLHWMYYDDYKNVVELFYGIK